MPATAEHVCPECGVSLGSDALANLCPACLLQVALTDSTVDSRVPSFPDHEIVEEIGRGGMGIIYRALQISLNRSVALKMIQGIGWTDEQSLRRFRAEAEAVALLEHPNLIPIYEVGESGGTPFYTMKLVEGGSLDDRMAEFGPEISGETARHTRQRLTRIARLVVCLARAMHFAHTRGVLHRDLKPANILLDEDDTPYITDFGLAKRFDENEQITHTGAALGTPSYMAPEQVESSRENASTATDVHGLGAVLYRLLAGRAPFVGANPMETMRAVLEKDPVRPTSLCHGVDRDLETICLRCLEKQRERRYRSALELADDLDNYLRGDPIQARPINALGRLLKWTRRSPAQAALALVSVAAIIVILILQMLNQAELEKERDHAREQERNALREGLVAVQARDDAERALALSDYWKADAAFEDGDNVTALACLASLLRRDPSNHVAAERLLYALTHRQFALPAVAPLQHEARVITARFVLDGERVLTASTDGVIKLWPADMSATPVSLQIGFSLSAVDFSSDGKRVILGGTEGRIELWDLEIRQRAHMFQTNGTSIAQVLFSPGGERAMTRDGSTNVFVWDVRSGKRLAVFTGHSRYPLFASFSPDGAWALSGGMDHTAQIWNTTTGKPVGPPILQNGPVRAGGFSPDGRRATLASESHYANVWDAGKGNQDGKWMAHDHPVISARFSFDGGRIITGTRQHGYAQVWDAVSGEALSERMFTSGSVIWAGFSPFGRRIATVSSDNTVRIWSGLTYEPLGEPILHDQPVRSVEFSRSGELLLTASHGNAAHLWDIRTMPAPKKSIVVEGAAIAATYNPDGTRLLLGTAPGGVECWELETARRIWSRRDHTLNVFDLAFSSDGGLAASCSADYTARLYNAATGQPVGEALNHQAQVHDLDFSSFTNHLATAANHGGVRIWDTSTGDLMLRTGNPLLRATSVEYSPNGRRLVGGSVRQAQIWDALTGEAVTPPLPHDALVTCVGFSADGLRVVTGTEDGVARVWNAQTGQPLTSPMLHGDKIQHVQFSPTGGVVLTTSDDNTARIWDAESGGQLTENLQHGSEVWTGAFSPDGRRFATGCSSMARIWDVATGLPLTPKLPYAAAVWAVEFHPAKSELLVSGWKSELKLHEFDEATLPVPAWFPELAEALARKRLDENRRLVSVDSAALHTVKERIAAAAITDSPLDRWGRWLVANPATRTVSHRFGLRKRDR